MLSAMFIHSVAADTPALIARPNSLLHMEDVMLIIGLLVASLNVEKTNAR